MLVSNAAAAEPLGLPLIMPLGDQALLVRFDDRLTDHGNRAAIGFADRLRRSPPEGVTEFDPNLVSVLVRFDPKRIEAGKLAGELRLLLSLPDQPDAEPATTHSLPVRFGGDAGPDLAEAAASLAMTPQAFIAQHNAAPLRVLTTGFAPGFVYCGFHAAEFTLPRRNLVRGSVPPGTILFAAGQTAITATAVPTGWHVIGTTDFRNFDTAATPPTMMREGDHVRFEALP